MSNAVVIAKATSVETRSNAIVVSFNFDWYDALTKGTISAILRKRIPVSVKPEWLYLHINRPKSAICGRADVRDVRHINLDTAVRYTKQIGLSKSEIITYFGSAQEVGIYWIGDITLSETELPISKLKDHFIYNPPQSFFILSKDGLSLLDSLSGFSDCEQGNGEEKRI